MYGEKGPPKGYSVPRYDTNAAKHCQLCSSTEHWTFECPKKASASTSAASAAKKSSTKTVKLSRSQMLKYGVKPKLATFTPEPTEREVFDGEMKELRAVLTAEVRSEVQAAKEAAEVAAREAAEKQAAEKHAADAAPEAKSEETESPAKKSKKKSKKSHKKSRVKDEEATETVAVKKEKSEERE